MNIVYNANVGGCHCLGGGGGGARVCLHVFSTHKKKSTKIHYPPLYTLLVMKGAK